MKFTASTILATVSLLSLAACSANPDSFTDGGRRDARAGEGGDTGGRLCVPGERRCNADTPQQTEQCSTDGSAWTAGPLCDEAVGQMCGAGVCQDRCNPAQLSYLGCDYWPTVTVNSALDTVFTFAIVLANPQTYPVAVTITGGTSGNTISRTLDPGSVQTLQLPWVQALGQIGGTALGTSAAVAHGAYHVQANGPIAAYQFNPLTFEAGGSFSFTNDASLLLPTRVLTTHYLVVTHDNDQLTDQLGRPINQAAGGFVSIVGTNANPTTVTVRLSAGVSAGPGVTASGAQTRMFTLGEGDVVQLVGSEVGQDLTGTVIEADYPVAVFTGHDCTNIPAGNPACDHLEEQLFPNETWGQHYAVTQLRDRSASERSVIRIVSNHAGLHLTFDGITAPAGCGAALDSGRHCEFETASSFQVSGDQPFLVMQFMRGAGANTICQFDPLNVACEGDPASVMEVPVEQYRRNYDFLVPDTYSRNFVNVTRAVGTTVTLDGVQLAGSSSAAGAGYEVLFVPVNAGPHHIETAPEAQGVGIKVYGVAPYTSYMYPGGLDLAQISPPG